MTRPILALAVLFVALLAWERSLARTAVLRREAHTRVGHVLDEERRASLPVAAVKVEVPGEATHLYGRVRGRWAALSHRRAQADQRAVAELLGAVAEAQGTIVSEDPAAAADYGLSGAEAIVVSLCGRKVLEDPAGDVLEAFELGRSLGERGASYLRRRGSPAIWKVEADPRALLVARVAPGLPPLLEPYAIPSSWEGFQRGVTDVFVDRADGASLHCERRLRDPETDPPAQGEPPWRWVVVAGDEEFASAPAPARGYELFLARAPYVDVLDVQDAAGLGFDRPAARVTLGAPEEEPLEVLVGAPTAEGRVPLLVPSLARLVLVEPEVARLLTPAAEWFSPGDPQNPWDPYLRAAQDLSGPR